MINDDIERNQLFTRRAFILTSGKIGLLSILAGRMYYMQAMRSNDYKTLSEKNRISLIPLYPARGNLIDRNGKLIAISKENFRIVLDRRENPNYESSLEFLQTILPIPEKNRQKIYQKISRTSVKVPIVLFERASWQEVALIEENLPYIPGIYVEINKLRFYPYDFSTSHLVGYIGSVNEQEKKDKFYQAVGDFDIGKAGIEKYYDETLRGSFGYKQMEVNAHGLFIRELIETKSTSGQELNLTIDVELQNEIYQKFSKYVGGAAIAIDITNGHILNFISAPGFDPNRFVGGVPSDYWQELLQDNFKPLINRAINNNYPPGSIFKLIVILAALEAGVPPEHQVTCTGHMTVGSRRFRCWYKPGHGTLDMYGAIKHSCNSYMYAVSKIIGAEAIINMAKKFGFGEKTGINLPGELSGFIPDKDWKINKLRQGWQVGDTVNTSIGQGYTLVTPLQLACMATAIANGGKMYKPTFLATEQPQIIRELGIPEQHLNIIRQGMFQVSNVPGGTAYGSRVHDEKYRIAAKTGTAQVMSKRDDNHNLSASSVHWTQRNHALCIAYGPFDSPKFACAVIVDHGGSGSSDAAPMARDILHGLMKRYC
ncbi:MAG: pbpA1 [Rickettsiaceae bacterium]|jgi:penicillin-binding protein 2|nr:pbpA1 [Rickettsiaceae bacterium]